MYIAASSLDDLLGDVYRVLLGKSEVITATRGGFREETGVLLELKNPLARLSRSASRGRPFSALGELIWYLSGSDDVAHMVYYLGQTYATENSSDGLTVHGAYGPRFFSSYGENQIENIIQLLRKFPSSRRAVMQIYSANDIGGSKRHQEIPCTCTLQFIVRDRRLHLFANLRSSDSYLGLPHDVFSFTMIQEIVARSLGVGLGSYKHFAGSLHLYEDRCEDARKFVQEGWQTTLFDMPPMPEEDPWDSVDKLIRAERIIRNSGRLDFDVSGMSPYWKDLISLLQVLRAYKNNSPEEIRKLCDNMHSEIYSPYIQQKYLPK